MLPLRIADSASRERATTVMERGSIRSPIPTGPCPNGGCADQPAHATCCREGPRFQLKETFPEPVMKMASTYSPVSHFDFGSTSEIETAILQVPPIPR